MDGVAAGVAASVPGVPVADTSGEGIAFTGVLSPEGNDSDLRQPHTISSPAQAISGTNLILPSCVPSPPGGCQHNAPENGIDPKAIDSCSFFIILQFMKTLLAILLSFIISEAPVLAERGYTLPGSSTNLSGLYAGVLIPISDVLVDPKAQDFGANSLGLFTLSIPTTGLGSGSAVIFSNGRTFTGTIQALLNPDPSSLGILGVINATFDYTLEITSSTSEAITASAAGSFDATVVTDAQSVGGFGLDLDGTSQVNVDQGFVSGSNGSPIVTEQITFQIEGFEQSNTPSTTTTTTTGT